MFYVIADADRARARADARRGPRHRARRRDDPRGGREQLPGRPPREPRIIRHVTISQLSGPPPASRRAPQERRHRLHRRAGLGRGPPHGPACSIDRRAAPAPAPRWPRCMPGASWRLAPGLPPRGHPRHGLHRPAAAGDRASGPTLRWCRRCAARPGSPASPTTWSIPAIPSLTDSLSVICGDKGIAEKIAIHEGTRRFTKGNPNFVFIGALRGSQFPWNDLCR